MAMSPGMKMLFTDRMRQRPESNYRSEYGGDSERRMIGYDRNYQTENRRRRDSRGRYMMGGEPHMMDDYDEDESRSQTWYPPHMMGGSGSRYGFGDVYAHINAPGSMNRPEYGGMESNMTAPVDEHTARKWVQKMDGGEHFKVEQTEQQRMAICPDCDKFSFYTAMNAMYSDYCETAKKMNIDRPDYYAHLAKDFLKDKDAKPGKLRRYMEHIAA